MRTLLLFTASYPYDAASEETFLVPELRALTEAFGHVLLVPRSTAGSKLPVPPGVEVDETYASQNRMIAVLQGLLRSSHLRRDLMTEIVRVRSHLLHPARLLRLLMFLGWAEHTCRWLSNWLRRFADWKPGVLLYSYWFDETTMGLLLAKRSRPELQLVSRAHGFDVYEELYYPYYLPMRPLALAGLNHLFPASEHAARYVRSRYPELAQKVETAHLAVTDPGFRSRPSEDSVFRIVSCAHIVALKRIDLLIAAIGAAARRRPAQRFEWLHFGGGASLQALREAMQRAFPKNAVGAMPGDVTNQKIMGHYRANPVDVFANVSETEGGAPVSIMEAISCGIPVLATAVGGNQEIVSDRNGMLVGPDASVEQVADALLTFLDNPDRARQMRVESRAIWEHDFNAAVTFPAFARRLASIGEG